MLTKLAQHVCDSMHLFKDRRALAEEHDSHTLPALPCTPTRHSILPRYATGEHMCGRDEGA